VPGKHCKDICSLISFRLDWLRSGTRQFKVPSRYVEEVKYTLLTIISENQQVALRAMHIPDRRDEKIAKRYFDPFIEMFVGKKKVLELASGQGFFLKMLKDAGIESLGVEVDSSLCHNAKSLGLNVVRANLFDYLKATKDKFDGCFASHIVEHFLPSDVQELFRLVHEVIEPGGILIIVTPNIANLRRAVGDFWRDPTHVRPYPISALNKLLEQTGWSVIKSGYHTDRPFSLRRTMVYYIRNLLIGHYWTGDDLYVVAERL